jgi:hypothetical protein
MDGELAALKHIVALRFVAAEARTLTPPDETPRAAGPPRIDHR